MYPHRIRLRGPWTVEPLARAVGGPEACIDFVAMDLPPARVMRHPCFWRDGGLTDFAGRARHVRNFGSPRRLDAHERVWLTCAAVAGHAEFQLNGRALGTWDGAGPPFQIDVTDSLREHNQLEIVVTSSEAGGGIPGEVALEIRCLAWLRHCQIEGSMSGGAGILRVSGEVVGQADRPLDLYAILGRSTAIQASVIPTPDGKTFELMSEPLPPERWQDDATVRLELVDAANVWYVLEQTVGFRPREETS